MMKVASTVTFVLLLAFVSFAVSERSWGRIFDDFTIGDSKNLNVPLNAYNQYPIVRSTYTDSSSFIGGERDHVLRALSGTKGKTISKVSNGVWNVTTPRGGRAVSFMQYDGNDNGSPSCNPTGLGGMDFTAKRCDSISIFAFSSKPNNLTVTIYDMNGGVSRYTANVNQKPVTDYIIPYLSFVGNADFTSVGSVELSFQVQQQSWAGITIMGTSAPLQYD